MMKAVLQIAPRGCAGCVKKIEDHQSQLNSVKTKQCQRSVSQFYQ